MMPWSGSGAASGWVFWFLGAAALVIVVLSLLSRTRPRASGGDEAAAILAGRFARSEIDAAEYAWMRAVMSAPERGHRGRLAVVGALVLIVVIALGVFVVGGPSQLIGGTAPGGALGPGAPGFVAGTTAAPRVIRIAATDQLRFAPAVVPITAGETITFQVANVGMQVHEFKVGPAADVAADTPGTPEIADIAMMGVKTLTYTFNGPGPFAFACHAPGHFEAGMIGSILIQP